MSDELNDVARKTESETQHLAAFEVIAGPSIENPASAILKLNIDAFDELFEWLSLIDLFALRKTCKRLKLVVDFHLRSFYPAIKLGYGKIESIFQLDAELKFSSIEASCRKSIKQISLSNYAITKTIIESFEDLLSQIEVLQIGCSIFDGDFYENLLKFCINLKYLYVWRLEDNINIGSSRKWLLQNYPKLEHIILKNIKGPDDEYPISELQQFFNTNRSIRTFSTTLSFIWLNRECFIGSNAKLKQLTIQGDDYGTRNADVFDLLHQLFEQGFYETLHFHVKFVAMRDHMIAITSLPNLEKLCLDHIHEAYVLPSLPSTKELILRYNSDASNLQLIDSHVENLERIWLKEASYDNFIQFIRHLPNLKQIKIDVILVDEHFNNNIINMFALQKMRQQLPEARQITIYVDDNVYVATKWATKTKTSLIKLKRAEAYEWEDEHILFSTINYS